MAMQNTTESYEPRFPSPVEQRAERILDVVLAFAMGEYDHELSLTGDDSVFDGLSAGINVLGEELKSSTRALKKHQQYLQSIHQSMGEALFVLDTRLHIKTVNAAALSLTGYGREELIGAPFSMLFSPEQFEQLQLGALVAEEAARHKQETLCYTCQKTATPVNLSVSTLFSEEPDDRGLVCIAQDITERKQFEEALLEARAIAEQANQAKSAFLASTSHELRTPLNAIIGYSQLIIEELNDCYQEAIELVPDLQKIELAGQYLLTLINNILDLSKIEAGKMDLLLEPFQVHHMVHTVGEIAQPLIDKNNNRIEIVASPELGEIVADATKTQQILFNLISNAAKFTTNGTVTITAGQHDDESGSWFSFCVKDTGIGMSEEHLGRLFQPFSQAHNAISKEYGGTGLGLALCKRFSELMGGSVSVSSTLGVGSAFTVLLPTKVSSPLSELARR